MRTLSRVIFLSLGTLALGALALVPLTGHTEEKPAWGPYLKDKKGEVKPLPDKPEKMKDEDWRKIAYTDFDGIKPRVAVYLPPITQEQLSTSQMNSDLGKLILLYSERGGQQPDGAEKPEIQLRQALGATNRFRMVEGSSSADNLLNEQDFGASDRVSAASAAKLKQITGAQYVARVEILEINPEKEAKNMHVAAGALTGSALALGSVGVSGKVAYCAINAKIVNVETGEIVTDLTAVGTSRGGGTGLAFGGLKGLTGTLIGGMTSMNSNTAASLGEAIQACVNKVAFLAAKGFEDLPVTMNVLDVDGSTVTVEGGRDLGLQAGMPLRLESNLGPITNAKGDTVGWKRRDSGEAKVVRVQALMSTCELVTGGSDTKRGDFATFEPKRGK